MRLSLHFFSRGVTTESGCRVVYNIERDAAYFGAATVDGPCLVWELGGQGEGAVLSAEVAPDPADRWLLRCDRVDFPPGGVAHRHTHPGPGIRVLLRGHIRIDSRGTSHRYAPLEPWFESGPEPVLAEASPSLETSFVRVMLLPREWEGKRTIRYVVPGDADKPKTQRATVFFDQPIELSPQG